MGADEKPQVFSLPVKVEPSPRWIRVVFGGETIADSKRALLAIQYGPGVLPTYYFPRDDVKMAALTPHDSADATTARWSVSAGGRVAEAAAWSPLDPPEDQQALKDTISFTWDRMDSWHEEAEEVFVHARDPHKRVDALLSSRRVQVALNGVTLADTRAPRLLFETWLPTRYYIPEADVRMDYLVPSALTTQCPYKGEARYWSVRTQDGLAENIVWSYPEPVAQCPTIRGLYCFYNEKVDIMVDGEPLARPLSPWS